MAHESEPPEKSRENGSDGSAPCGAWIGERLDALGDPEGARVPDGLPDVVDAHVHLFPPRLFEAIWRWFDRHGWPIRYRFHSEDVIAFLTERGVRRIVGLHYAHKPGIARSMNAYAGELQSRHASLRSMGTVFPGEPDQARIVEEAFALGLGGIKLHTHVQCVAADDDRLHDVYRVCAEHDRPVVIHAGREPQSPAYACDTYAICGAERMESALHSFPRTRFCVPHLGADEFGAYARLLERYDNLWLDTTMVLADYFPGEDPRWLVRRRPDRIFYGTDFPNLPFAWDRELRHIAEMGLRGDDLANVLGENAKLFYGFGA